MKLKILKPFGLAPESEQSLFLKYPPAIGEYEVYNIRKNIWGTGNMGIQIWVEKNKIQDYVLQESDFNLLEKEGYVALIS